MKKDNYPNIEKMYDEEIEKNSLLSTEEEIDLFNKYKSGDMDAKKKIIESNLRLVRKISSEFETKKLDKLDLIQEGSLGLIRAVETFDLSKNNKFSTYATVCVENAIKRAIMDKDRTIRIPVYMHENIILITNALQKLRNDLCREPSFEDLSKEVGLTLDEIIKIFRLVKKVISLDEPVKFNDEMHILDTVEDPKSTISYEYTDAAQKEREQVIKEVLEKLSDKQRVVLEKRYGLNGEDPDTLINIAKELGVSKETVRKRQNDALSILQKPSNLKTLSGVTPWVNEYDVGEKPKEKVRK